MDENETSPLPFGQQCRRFSLAEIQSATQNFSEALIIGRGGFGKVYKGFFDDGDKIAAAIKRLDLNSNQGAHEFWTEIAMLSKFRHCNVVSLIGYCNDNREMVLVYEYMPCGTLYDHLHNMPARLSWTQRLKVCIGAARGLDYLHTGTSTQHRIIHRDVKSSNILLDMSFQAKVSDFGLSKVGPSDQAFSYVNTNIKGSFGYLDPEYFFLGRLTRKSDVYSFGVVLFEVLCGRLALDKSLSEEQQNLANWVQNRIKQENLDEIIDPSIQGTILPGCLKEFTKIAEQCLHRRSKKRPTMAEVVVRLESALALQEGTDSLTDEETCDDSGDSDNQENADCSFTVGEDSNVNQENVQSIKEHDITGVSGHQDEWILGAAEGEQSYITSADHKLTSSGVLEDENNTKTSLINEGLIDEAMNCENEKNSVFVPEEVVLDADASYVSGSSGDVGHQDLQTVSKVSGGQSDAKHTTKIKFTRKLKRFFFPSSGPSGSSKDNGGDVQEVHLPRHMSAPSGSSKDNGGDVQKGHLPRHMSAPSGSSKEISGDVQEVPLASHVSTLDLKIFSFDELDSATQNFKQENCLGQGEFGRVYKGWVHETTYSPSTLDVGMIVAIKRLYPGKVNSCKLRLEQLEQCNHASFVKLLGYCLEDEEFLLVYEFMEKGSLASHLFECAEPLPWFTRVKILLGAAEGLAFLHTTLRVSSNKQFGTHNILLNGDFNSKLSYLGHEPRENKLPAITETSHNDYDMTNDVFEFGVVVLETLTGLPKNTSSWERKKAVLNSLAALSFSELVVDEFCGNGDYIFKMVDPRLGCNYHLEGVVLLRQLAHRCLGDISSERPSMEQVLRDMKQVFKLRYNVAN